MNDIFCQNTEQLEILKKSASQKNGCRKWNEWRKENPNVRINLLKADFQKIDLREANFSGKIIVDQARQVNFIQAHFEETILESADFQGALLLGAKFIDVNLTNANFAKADLQESCFHNTRCLKTNMEKADLSNSNLEKIFLQNANLKQAILSGANLEKACLENVSLQQAFLDETNLSYANLNNVELTQATLTGASVYGIYGKIFSGKRIICKYLDVGKILDEEFMVFTDQKQLLELIIHLENGTFGELYKMRKNEILGYEKMKILGIFDR